eukprot:2705264-Pyramimonas_sp.AAC.1
MALVSAWMALGPCWDVSSQVKYALRQTVREQGWETTCTNHATCVPSTSGPRLHRALPRSSCTTLRVEVNSESFAGACDLETIVPD